jgi:hypothetical protein
VLGLSLLAMFHFHRKWTWHILDTQDVKFELSVS